MPDFIVTEFLNTRQRSLQEISLITDVDCPEVSYEHLPTLDQVRSISWTGIDDGLFLLFTKGVEFAILEAFLVRNAPHLEQLTLHSADNHSKNSTPWNVTKLAATLLSCRSKEPSTPLAGDCQELSTALIPGGSTTPGSASSDSQSPSTALIPLLRSLTLSWTSFKGDSNQLLNIFDFSRIRKLVLLQSSEGDDLLKNLVSFEGTLGLEHFEFISNFEEKATLGDMNNMAEFLSSFQRLQNLFLVAHEFSITDTDWEPIFHAIANHHASSLKRLVVQGAQGDIESGHVGFEKAHNGLKRFYMVPKLRCLGVGMSELNIMQSNLVSNISFIRKLARFCEAHP